VNYAIWLRELTKYKEIIDLAKHMLFEKNSGRRTDYIIPQLHGLIDACELTTMRIAGNDGRPLSAAESMFQNNIDSNSIRNAIEAAELHFTETLGTIQKAVSAKYTYPLRNFSAETAVYDAFKGLGAVIAKDFLVLGLTVHLFEVNPELFKKMRSWLEEKKP